MSRITFSTPNEIINFIDTIPMEQRHAVTTETILIGVNKKYNKNYNFYHFETGLRNLLGIKKVGTTTTNNPVDSQGHIIV